MNDFPSRPKGGLIRNGLCRIGTFVARAFSKDNAPRRPNEDSPENWPF